MKRPPPERSNTHILHLAKRVALLPFVLIASIYAWMTGRVRGLNSPETLHAKDKLRQSRARRTLRGLPPDHVQEASVTRSSRP